MAVWGYTKHDARLWLRVGSFQFQPAELTRLFVAIFAARYIYDHRHHIAAPWRFDVTADQSLPYVLPLVGAIVAAAAGLVVQAEVGMGGLVRVLAFLLFLAVP